MHSCNNPRASGSGKRRKNVSWKVKHKLENCLHQLQEVEDSAIQMTSLSTSLTTSQTRRNSTSSTRSNLDFRNMLSVLVSPFLISLRTTRLTLAWCSLVEICRIDVNNKKFRQKY